MRYTNPRLLYFDRRILFVKIMSSCEIFMILFIICNKFYYCSWEDWQHETNFMIFRVPSFPGKTVALTR